ncbi:MAG: tail fiber protein [Treponema sp.]|nr:tail fiber protein [Treponema sp.]
MASVYRYDGAGGDCTFISISGRIKDCIVADWNQYILLKAGERITPDYMPEQDDIIYMRRIPKGTAVAITLGVIALVGAVGAGVYSYVQQKKINEYQEKLAENQKKMSAGSVVQKLPYVRGASNSPATGHSFPYILGETLFTPYKLCPDHIRLSGTDGADLYWYMVLECGFAPLCFRKLMLGTNTIISFSGNTPQNGRFSFEQGAYYDAGNFAEIRQTGDFNEAEFNRKVIYTNYMEEIPHRHLPDDATQEEAQEIEDEWRHGLVKQLPDHVMAVEVIVLFDGLRKFDEDNGAWISASATLQVQWTNVDSPEESDWHNFDLAFNQNGTRSNTFTRNVRKQLRFTTGQDFTVAQSMGKNMSIRIRRTTPKSSGTAKDSVYLMAVQSTIYDAKKSTSEGFVPAMPLEPEQRDKCTRIGIRIKSTPATDGYLDSFSVIQSGCARTWNGSAWSNTKVPERNLAAWVLEILTSAIHEPSKFLDTELDLESFGEWYEYCSTNGIYADGAVTDATAKKGLLEKLLSNGNAALIMNETSGLMEVAVDSGRDYPVALLTSDNILSMTALKTVRRIADGIKVTYVNRDAGYEADSVTFMRDGGEYDPASDTLTTTALSYITDFTQAFRRAWRTMAEEIARPMSATVKVGQAGGFYRMFDCISLQHDALSIGLGHGIIKALAWQNGSLTHIELAGFVDFPSSGRCGIIINCTNKPGVISLEVEGEGRTSILAVVTEFSDNASKIPSPGDTLSFGLLDGNGGFSTITTKMLITGSSPDDDGYTLQLTEYNEDVYSYGNLPEYHSNITARPESSTLKIEDVREYAEPSDVNAAIAELEAGTGSTAAPPDSITGLSASAGEKGVELTWNAPGRGLKNSIQKYEIQVTYDRTAQEPEWENAGTSKTNSFSFMFQRNVHGYPEASEFATWAFRIRPINIYNLSNDWTECPVITTSYGTWLFGQAVPDVKIQQNNSTGRVLQATFSMPPRSDLRQLYGTIRYRVQIQRRLEQGYTPVGQEDYDAADEWWAPATSADPYSGENNYKDESADPDYIVAQETYLQTLPLVGQSYVGEGKTQNTPYRIRVSAENEAGTSGWAYPSPFTATVTGIFDLVKANENFKELYVSELSSICANLGRITGGTMAGGEFDYWTLKTLINAHPDTVPPILNKDFMGAFSVGDDNQHLRVIPQIDIDGRTILGYEIIFKVGKFVISSSYSKLNGEFIIQTNEESLERTRLTPYGTYFESRKLPTDNEWNVIAKQDVAGTLTKMVYSENDSLVISNQGISSRREDNCDIGREYLSSNSLVYHFDVDSLDQYGGSGLTVTKATGAPDPVYVDDEDSEHYGINMAPAIIREAPYSEIGKSLYGLYSLEHSLGTGSKWTVDVWIKYVWAEDQELMRVEVGNDVLLIVNETSEPNYNEPQEGEPPYNTDTMDPEGKPYNVAASSGCVLVYNNTHKIQLKDIGLLMETDNWYHIAVVLNNGTLTFMGSSDATLATLNPVVKVDLATQGSGGTVIFNSSKESFLCDELFIDTTVSETDVKFLEGSSTKIPWAANSYDADYFILNKSNNSRLITNLFDDDLFKQKVQALFNEYNKYEIGFIQEFGGPDDKVPLGWFPCRWQAISRTTYAVLFGIIGTYWGAGDGSTTFNLPDSREISFVGISKCSNPNHYIYDNTEVNPATGTVGNQDHDVYMLGEFKDDQFQQHKHSLTYAHRHGGSGQTLNQGTYGDQVSNYNDGTSWPNSGRYGSTTHGKRVGVNYIIRAF